MVFREREEGGDTWYAAALDFNIVESGDTPDEVLFMLFDAMRGYVESAKKSKARPHILNQIPDKEYKKIWDAFLDKKIQSSLKGITVHDRGERSLVAA